VFLPASVSVPEPVLVTATTRLAPFWITPEKVVSTDWVTVNMVVPAAPVSIILPLVPPVSALIEIERVAIFNVPLTVRAVPGGRPPFLPAPVSDCHIPPASITVAPE